MTLLGVAYDEKADAWWRQRASQYDNSASEFDSCHKYGYIFIKSLHTLS